KINNNLPTVAVHEFAIHPTAGEMVIATHGRSLWVVDISGLRQVTAATVKADAQLMKPTTAIKWKTEANHGRTNRRFVGENPVTGATLFYALGKKAEKASIKVMDHEGKTVREINVSTEPGLHRVVWNLSAIASGRPAGTEGGDAAAGGGRGGPRGGGGGGA